MLHLCRNHLMVVWQWKRQTASRRHKNTKWNDFPLSIISTFHFVTCCQWAPAYYQSYDCFNAIGSCSYFHSFPSFFFPFSLSRGSLCEVPFLVFPPLPFLCCLEHGTSFNIITFTFIFFLSVLCPALPFFVAARMASGVLWLTTTTTTTTTL